MEMLAKMQGRWPYYACLRTDSSGTIAQAAQVIRREGKILLDARHEILSNFNRNSGFNTATSSGMQAGKGNGKNKNRELCTKCAWLLAFGEILFSGLAAI